ncbi:MAG: hypothetical protein RR183_04845 [Bacteroidales bacterium]
MKHKILFCFFGFIIFCACKHIGIDRTVVLVDVPTVYNWKGVVKNYHFDKSKKKVINYLGGVRNLKNVLEHTDSGKIDKIIRNNPDFQFIFYVDRVTPDDTIAFMDVMRKYRCTFPVILDFEEEFYKANKDRLCLEKPRRMAKIGYICDEECWI